MNFRSATVIGALLAAVLLTAAVHGRPSCGDSGDIKRRLVGETESDEPSLPPVARTIEEVRRTENPIRLIIRQKRLSDQRRAELETLVALSKMTAKAVSRSGRHLDPARIGR